MKFHQHFSGSSGNMYEVTAQNGHRLLIECGVRWPLLIKALDYKMGNIEGCLISHSHKDHCHAVDSVIQAGIDVYTSAETIEKCGLFHRNVTAIKSKDLIWTESFQVYVFYTIHDCPGSVGFVIRELATKEWLLFVTDTKCIVPRFEQKFSIVAIEASYCGETLERKVAAGIIDEALARRLLDSHMEVKETMRYIDEFIDKEKLHEIHLLHISGDNNDRERCRKRFEKHFMKDVVIV
jgi:phosphoribosyl 1,2-cyclic phosphodiesterase